MVLLIEYREGKGETTIEPSESYTNGKDMPYVSEKSIAVGSSFGVSYATFLDPHFFFLNPLRGVSHVRPPETRL